MRELRPYCFGFAALGFFVLLPFIGLCQDSLEPRSPKMHLKGFIKDLQSASFTDSPKSLMTLGLIHNRLNFKWDLDQDLGLRMEARNRLFYGEQVKSVSRFGKYVDNDIGFFDLSYNVVEDTSLVLNTTIDRALLYWTNNRFELTIGRQRVNWGVNLVWNPNDIFNTYNYFDFDYEERPGSDAIRVQYNAGTFSSIQAVYKPARESGQQVGAILYKTNVRQYDFQGLAGVFHDDLVAGAGWAGSIQQTGFKAELTYFYPYSKSAGTNQVLAASVSFDKTFRGNYFGIVSYLYNGNGREVLYGAADFNSMYLSAKNLMPFKHTVFFQLSKTLNPLVTGSFASMYSPTKNSLILFPTLSVSLAESWDLVLIGQLFFGSLDDVYRSLGNAVFLRLRWSF